MKPVDQHIDVVVAELSPLDVAWMDDVAARVITKLSALPRKETYGRDDIAALLDAGFEDGILVLRLFLALSKDQMEVFLRRELGPGGIGTKRYAADRAPYLDALERLGLADAMAQTVNYRPIWSDILVERLRSGRGSAIQGQRRGRGLEDFVEAALVEIKRHDQILLFITDG
ncbi:hypothetical protein [Salinarimonas chemoclinalis]|uniref:hypothetical protein n=1 Tax=Salinarimonas chemoclinalis TaxID=3241599 RepID=UPI003556CCEB